MNEQATQDLEGVVARLQASSADTAKKVRDLAAAALAGHQADDSAQVEDAVGKLKAVADVLDAAAAIDTTGGATTTTPTDPAPEAPATEAPAAA